MKTRFSKETVANAIYRKILVLEKTHKFDRGNGWAQVKGKPIESIVAYGEFRGLLDLINDLGIIDNVTVDPL